MKSSAVVEGEIAGQLPLRFAFIPIGVQIHLFVFDVPSQSPDEHVVDPLALAVDADASAGVLENLEPRSARGLCA
jgi:hypothetical protein